MVKKYDVFLSFRGEDTRNNILSHHYDALVQKKIATYVDYHIQKGDEISRTLIKAIEDSYASIVIFSENYASSKWCLDEISKFMECKEEEGQVVIPVFYKIDPSHVRKQTRVYKEPFDKHKQDQHKDRVQKWRDSLNKATGLAAWDGTLEFTGSIKSVSVVGGGIPAMSVCLRANQIKSVAPPKPFVEGGAVLSGSSGTVALIAVVEVYRTKRTTMASLCGNWRRPSS